MRKNNLKVIGVITLIFLTLIIYPVAYMSSVKTVKITVNDKERITTGSSDNIQSKFLVYTENEVFENTDALLFFKFNSADLQNNLKPGETYIVRVAGWRIRFLSKYRNIIEIK